MMEAEVLAAERTFKELALTVACLETEVPPLSEEEVAPICKYRSATHPVLPSLVLICAHSPFSLITVTFALRGKLVMMEAEVLAAERTFKELALTVACFETTFVGEVDDVFFSMYSLDIQASLPLSWIFAHPCCSVNTLIVFPLYSLPTIAPLVLGSARTFNDVAFTVAG